jgi:hypothetical protein
LRWLWGDLYGDEPPEALRGLLAPNPEFRDLSTDRLLVMASGTSASVLRRGRAMIELGRPAFGDITLLREVAALIGDPNNMRLMPPRSGSGPGRARHH